MKIEFCNENYANLLFYYYYFLYNTIDIRCRVIRLLPGNIERRAIVIRKLIAMFAKHFVSNEY